MQRILNPKQFGEIFPELLFKHRVKPPITFALIGINGHVLAGRFDLLESKKIDLKFFCGNWMKLLLPISVMFVDGSGSVIYTRYERPDEPVDLTNIDQPIGQA